VGLALARAALTLNDLPTAAASLPPALEACDGCVEAATLVAQCALRLDRPAEAAAVVEPALKTHPHEATLWRLLGQARRELGDGRGARAAYLAAVRNSASPPVEVLRELGRLEIAEGRWNDALKHLSRVAKLAPDDAEAWRQIALARNQRGQTGKAEAAFEACLRADPDRVDAWREWRKIAGADGREELFLRIGAAGRAAIANRLVEGNEQ
jgi:tetratricopeptide (TPR) repeat protein